MYNRTNAPVVTRNFQPDLQAFQPADSAEALELLRPFGCEAFLTLDEAVNKVADRPEEFAIHVGELTTAYVGRYEGLTMLFYPRPDGPPPVVEALALALSHRYLQGQTGTPTLQANYALAAAEGVEIRRYKGSLWGASPSKTARACIIMPRNLEPAVELRASAWCLGDALLNYPAGRWPVHQGNPYEKGTPACAQAWAARANNAAFAATWLSGDPWEGRAAARAMEMRVHFSTSLPTSREECWLLVFDILEVRVRYYDTPAPATVRKGRRRMQAWITPDLPEEQEAEALAWIAGAVLLRDEVKGLDEARVERIFQAFASAFLGRPIAPRRPGLELAPEAAQIAA
jgi:hypothetical protein